MYSKFYVLLDKANTSLDPAKWHATVKTIDIGGKTAVLVFRSRESADKCRERWNDPNVTTGNWGTAAEFVTMMQKLQQAGAAMVAIDYLPAAPAEGAQVLATDIGRFIQDLQTAFGVK
jgi:hypothetical protein